jgi:hypothetical protein
MALYEVGVGHNLAPELIFPVFPEPRGDGAAPVDRKYAVSGEIEDIGLYIVLHWDHVNDEEEYWDLLEQFGVNVNDSSPVTLYARDKRFTYRTYNGIAHLPEPNTDIKQSNFFLRDINMYITHLVQI